MAKKDDSQNTKKILMTAKGLQKLQEELEQLRTTGRRDVAKRLQEAIAYGDLSENAEYDEAKNQQAFLEARISELEEQIKSAEIVEESKGGVVQIGSKVTLKMIGGEQHEYLIVGSTEADPMSHKISNESPVGMAIIGHSAKEKVQVKAPGGMFTYEIVKVA